MASTIDIIIVTLKEKLGDKLPVVTPDSDINELGLDSLDIINFLFSVEEKTGVKVPDEDINAHGLRALKDFARYIDERRG